MQVQVSHDRARALEALQGYILSKAPGDVLTHEELRGIAGLTTAQVYGLVRRLNRDLIKGGRWLINVRRIGYKLATPTERLTHADGRRLRAMRHQRTGLTVLGTIPLKELSDADRQKHARLLDKLSHTLRYAHWNSQRTTLMAQRTLLQARKTEAAQARADAIVEQIRKLLG